MLKLYVALGASTYYFANSPSAIRLPAAIARGSVLGVIGLTNTIRDHTNLPGCRTATPSALRRPARPRYDRRQLYNLSTTASASPTATAAAPAAAA